MNTRSDSRTSQIKVFLEPSGTVHKEIGPVAIESLVFEGGGIRGIGYVGATRALFEAGIMDGVKRVAGTSAGAVTASVIALGYPQADIDRLLRVNDMAELMDAKNLFGPSKISKLMKHGYFNNGDKILAKARKISEERIKALITTYEAEHTGNLDKLAELDRLNINIDRATFQDVKNLARLMPDAGMKDLYIIAAKLPNEGSECEMKIFSAEHTPDVEIALAVRASVSLPRFLKPVELDGNKYVDGGVICNFPVDIFDNQTYKPENAYMFQGSNNQNFSTLGIKIDTESEIRNLLHAPIKTRPLKKKFYDKMYDQIAGLPMSRAYHMNHHKVRNHYSHRACQLGDEGIKTAQFDLNEEGAEQLIKRGYDDMKTWIQNYHDSALESRKFSSFAVMCECMDLEELEVFCDEVEKRPQDVMRVAGECGTAVPIGKINELLIEAKKILKEKIAARDVIRHNLSGLNLVLKKYDVDVVEIYSRIDVGHEVSEMKKWVMAAESALAIILASEKNYFVKRDDAGRVTKFVDELKRCVVGEDVRGIGFFWRMRRMEGFVIQRNISSNALI